MDIARKLHLLQGQIAFHILGELLGQDQDAVERRAQLMAPYLNLDALARGVDGAAKCITSEAD